MGFGWDIGPLPLIKGFNNMSANKNLFQVVGFYTGNILKEGFTSKMKAKEYRNKKLKEDYKEEEVKELFDKCGNFPYIVTPGPDHWRFGLREE